MTCRGFHRLGSVVLAVLMALVANTTVAANPQKIYRKAVPSVMTLEVENQQGERFTGSAVLVLKNDVALTAWHVVCDARSVWATFSDGARVRITGCIDKDVERDLAFLKLGKPAAVRVADLSSELEQVATRAYVIGAPKGYDFTISDGLISQIRRVDGFAQYQVSCPISPGNSGGPLLNERGQVTGIVSWTKSDAQNLSFAIPSTEVARLNVLAPVKSWAQLSSVNPPAVARHWVEPDELMSTDKGNRSFTDFTTRLEKAAGKKVTVTVSEEGKDTRFTFTVPQGPWK